MFWTFQTESEPRSSQITRLTLRILQSHEHKKRTKQTYHNELLPDPVVLFSYVFIILPFLPLPGLLRYNWHIIFILPLTAKNSEISLLFPSFSLSLNNLCYQSFTLFTLLKWYSQGQMLTTFFLLKACFQCLQTTHFPRLSSFYALYQQPHLLSLLKKHLVSLPLSDSEAVLLFPGLSHQGSSLLLFVAIKTLFLSSRCLQSGGR